MRLLLIIICTLNLIPLFGQQAAEQRVTLHLENITLEEALTVLAISYNVEFSYSDDRLPLQSKVNLEVAQEPLKEVLKRLLDPLALEYKAVRNRVVIRNSPKTMVQTVRGTVLDQVTLMPLPGASVSVTSINGRGTITDQHGRFRLEDIPIGRITLQVGNVGYLTREYANILLGTGKESVLDIRLEESVTTMDEVVVTADKNTTVTRYDAAVTSSHTFTAEETQRYAGSFSDPARMVTSFASVTGASDESNSLIVRGNSPRGVLWRIAGIEVPNPNHFTSEGASSGVVSILSPNIVGNTNFLTGAFPANFGNALSAVFDVSLREGNNEKREHAIQAGTLGLESSTEGPLSRQLGGSYLVNYRYSTLALLDKAGFDLNEASHHKDYQDVSFHISLPFARSSIHAFGIGGESVSDKNNDGIRDRNGSGVGIAGLTFGYRLLPNVRITSGLSWAGTDIDRTHVVSGLDAGPIRLEERYRKSYVRASFMVDSRVNEQISLQSGVIGSFLKYDFYMLNQDPTNPTYNTIVNFSEKGTTATWQVYSSIKHQLSEQLTAYYGVHLLHFNLTKDLSVEPRLGVRWQRNARTSFSLGYGRHSRIENLQYYLARDHQAGGNEVQLNRNLAFTKAHHVVAGLKHALWQGHWLNTEIYYQRLEDVPVQASPSALYASINEDTGFITDTLVNKGTGTNYGVEAGIEKKFASQYYYMVSGSLFQSLLSIDGYPQRNTAYNGNYSFHVLAGKEFMVGRRRHQLGINMKWNSAGGRRYVPIDVERSRKLRTQVYDWQSAFEDRFPDYYRLDLQISYRLNKPKWEIEWKLDVQNITDHHNASYMYYDIKSEKIHLKRQVGILPLLSCKVKF